MRDPKLHSDNVVWLALKSDTKDLPAGPTAVKVEPGFFVVNEPPVILVPR
jgi:hypothetical protein